MSSSKTTSRTASIEEKVENYEEDFSGHFDLIKLNGHLRLCLKSNTDEDAVDSDACTTVDVSMDEYIEIFHQLYKFFCMLGTVFGFVASDVKAKVEILSDYRKGPNGHQYEFVGKMIIYERESGYLKDNRDGNASRTFLRLHRALLFVSEFLRKTLTLAEEDGTGQIARETYKETLAKHHAWLIQTGALMAMYTLPTKKDLFKQLGVEKHFEPHEVSEQLNEGVRITKQIYDACQKLYKNENLLNLP